MIRSVVLLLLALALHAEILSRYEVPGMHCPLCTSAVKKSLKTLEGVKKVEVRLNTKSAAVWHDGALADEALRAAIATTGYEARLISREPLP